ncbi:hypothetical protein OIU77_027122 [Salix suchowensis]|uniref:Thaumatin-like protein n=1 Tax=Salix suchowensis TaxID=1278906 RepID=A0ABQ9BRQ6_9ROSI|nr:hypothetical protein OIU77_027122 [Salix suchowensis]
MSSLKTLSPFLLGVAGSLAPVRHGPLTQPLAPHKHASGLGPTANLTVLGGAAARPVTATGLLACQGYGSPPNTLAEYAIGQFANQDFIDISNIDGFNVPMEFSSASAGCSRVIKCTADIVGQCPNELKVPGGCNGPCPMLKTEEHCCNSGQCGPTTLSKYFKDRCPDAYSYPKDDPTSLFTCPTGTNYKVIFCP